MFGDCTFFFYLLEFLYATTMTCVMFALSFFFLVCCNVWRKLQPFVVVHT
jgi:hypothetical protein